MRIIVALSALLALTSFHSPAAAKEQDRTGTYVDGCLQTVNCSAIITKTGKGKWRMVWDATNRTNTKTYCKHVVDMKVGEGHSASEPSWPNVLIGKIDGKFVMASTDAFEGSGFFYMDGMPCEGVKLPDGERGTIGFNGIYNMEGDE